MYCPACPEERLLITDRSGIEIDYCAKCRGVWLDRGELDKLIERAGEQAGAPSSDRDRHRDRNEHRRDDRRSAVQHRDGFAAPKRKKKSFLSEFFEMGD
jgi:Zn-finger nucleic acid-binding protein